MKSPAREINQDVLKYGGSEKNPVLIFLHYFGGSSRSWKEVVKRLADDFICVAPDLRGFGESDARGENFSLEDYADDVAGLIEHFKIERFVLVGHSMGGKIALCVAARQPKNLESLVLLATSPPTPEPIADDERKYLLKSHGNRRAAEETVRKVVANSLPEKIFETAVEDNLRSSEKAWRAWLEDGSRVDISDSMAKIVVPARIVTGAKDKTIRMEVLEREVLPRLKNSRLVSIPDAGHLLPMEVPDEIAKLIRRQIQS